MNLKVTSSKAKYKKMFLFDPSSSQSQDMVQLEKPELGSSPEFPRWGTFVGFVTHKLPDGTLTHLQVGNFPEDTRYSLKQNIYSLLFYSLKETSRRRTRNKDGENVPLSQRPHDWAQASEENYVSVHPLPWRLVLGDSCMRVCVCVCVCVRHSVMSNSLQTHGPEPTWLLCLWDSPGKTTGVDSHSLLQDIFPSQGLNPILPHCRQILYCLGHQGSLGQFLLHSKRPRLDQRFS